MSYSMIVRAATKAAALAQLAERLDKLEGEQPCHKVDRPAAQAASEAMVGLLKEDENSDVIITVGGNMVSVEGELITSTSVSVTAYLMPRAIE